MKTNYDQARSWMIDKAEPAISGANGHGTTLNVARTLVNGFGLSSSDVTALLTEYSQAKCQPPWSAAEIAHKIRDAENASYDKPAGFMVHEKHSKSRGSDYSSYRPSSAKQLAPLPRKMKSKEEIKQTPMPAPIMDGARLLIETLFRPGEHVRIAQAVSDETGHETVSGNDIIVLSREDWLKRLNKVHGDPNGILSHGRERNGLYITVNPMKPGGKKDEDVTDYRHALLEFDTIPLEDQFSLYIQERLPCAAIIYSGGKSVHAWVKIDAQTRTEYDERVKFLYERFAAYGPDFKNKNPSRFSRLPSCVRGGKRQELHAISLPDAPIGCPDFLTWQEDIRAREIGRETTVLELGNYDTSKDSNAIIGANRYLCRGGSCLIVGPSGVGKSSLTMQFAISMATGKPFFGIRSVGNAPRRVLVIQAENDLGDLAEAFQGVRDGLEISALSDDHELLEKNLVFVTDTTHTGQSFASAVRILIAKHKPDIVIFDPLLSFIGADISKQEVCSEFLRGFLNPISQETGVIWVCIHHTGKTSTDKNAKQGWQKSDHAYAGMGSSELTNWARAVMVLTSIQEGVFCLKLAKRGRRAGATHPSGEPTTDIWMRWADKGICWEQMPEPAPAEKPERAENREKKEPGAPGKIEAIAGSNLHSFLTGCLDAGEGKNAIAKRLRNWLAADERKDKKSISESSSKRLIDLLVENEKLALKNDLFYAGKNK